MKTTVVIFKTSHEAYSFSHEARRKTKGSIATADRKVWLSHENDDESTPDYFIRLAQQAAGFKEVEEPNESDQ